MINVCFVCNSFAELLTCALTVGQKLCGKGGRYLAPDGGTCRGLAWSVEHAIDQVENAHPGTLCVCGNRICLFGDVESMHCGSRREGSDEDI